ncbi:MAG: ATP-grasp domain-containing protein [Gemmatimonadota bacterium]|nr:ATP-grasp domain-containing protein [Gemmatimonadota bacterium]
MSDELRVIIGSSGSTAAQNVAWALRRAAAPSLLIGVDAAVPNGSAGLFDLDVPVPWADEPDYIDAIKEIARREGASAFLPVMEPELLAASAHVDAFAAVGLDAVVSPEEAISVCRSKRALTARFERLGVPCPRVLRPDQVGDRAFARPDCGSGSRGARVLAVEDLGTALAKEPDLVLSEVVEGPEFSIDGYATDGRLIHAIARRRDEVRGGLAVRSEVVALDETVRALVEALCDDLRLDGFFNAQYLEDPEGVTRFFDLNPRPAGAMALSFAAGLDAPRYLNARLSGAQLEPGGTATIGLRLFRRWENVLIEPAEGAAVDR